MSGMEVDRLDSDLPMRRQRPPESNPHKVRSVAGPARGETDNLRADLAITKDRLKEQTLNVKAAKQKSYDLGLENQKLHAEFEAVVKQQAEQSALVAFLNEQLASKTKEMTEARELEGQMEAQIFDDQQKIKDIHEKYSAIFPQFVESQKLLMQLNQDVERLSRLMVEKNDEVIQLRFNNLQSQKAPQKKPPPRRGTRASLDQIRYSNTRTIQIPLNAIPVASTPRASNSPSQAKLKPTAALAQMLDTDVATVAPLVEKLQQLLLSDEVSAKVHKVTPKKRKQQKPKSVINNSELKNYLNDILRRATYQSFQVTRAVDFQTHTPADSANVSACEEGLAEPAANVFQWDFGPNYLRSEWNSLMVAKVVDLALQLDQDGEERIAASDVDRDHLENVMLDKLEKYRAEWKAAQPRFDHQRMHLETSEEGRDRAAHTLEQHQLAARSTSSKHRKYTTRQSTIELTINIKTNVRKADDLETWERLLEILERLGEQGMSSEEEDELEVNDAKILVYKVKICVWREPSISDYWRLVDAQTALFKKNHRGPLPAPRIRGMDAQSGIAPAPCGLPKVLYSQEWLKRQTPAYLRMLDVSKEAFALLAAATDRMAI
ncbi:hypothetical protein C8F01DRAFT_1331869 [Mycena amicta]|nr:hypothetical protein C8F01DRAFT_1331869 [Mycena amicta]